MARDTTEFLTAVRRAAFLPDASDQSSTDLLAFGDQELETLIADAIVAERGERFYRTEDQAIVPGTTRYRVPRRLMAGSIRAVTVVAPEGGLPEYGLGQVDPIDLRGLFSAGATANPAYYAFEGDFLNLGAVPAATGWTLRVHYIRQPGKMVLPTTTTTPRIFAVTTTTNIVLRDTAPDTDFTTNDSLVDIIRGEAPYDTVNIDLRTAGYVSPNLTLRAATPVVVSDFVLPPGSGILSEKPGWESFWLVKRDQTPFPQVPQVCWTALVYATAAAALAAVRDPGTPQMAARAAAAKTQAMNLMAPRDQRQTETIINPHSGLRNRHGRRWRR